MYLQGVSSRKVKATTEELSGHGTSASTISRIDKRLRRTLAAFAEPELATTWSSWSAATTVELGKAKVLADAA